MPTVTTTMITPLKALADPVRLAICRLLADEELCVCHLVEELGLSQPLLSHHLKILREAVLVETRRHSYWTYYRLAPQTLEYLGQELMDMARGTGHGPTVRPCC